jgi:SAM-dependent methyltransferase
MSELLKEKCHVCHKTFEPYPMGDKNGYNLFACRHCGSVMVDPWVTAAMREQFFGDIQPEITHVPNPTSEINDLKKTIGKIMPQHAGKKFLDVACRNGYSVVAAKLMGMDAYGIDQHDFFIRFAQTKYDQTLFENVMLQEYCERGKQADLIFARDAFCEQTDLEGFAASLSRTLAPGGMLYIEEPNGNHFNVPGSFTTWQVVFPPMNFVYLSRNGLTGLLERHGFRIQKIFFSWRPVTRLIAVKN